MNINIVTWIPEAWHPAIFLIKGLLALTSVLMLVYHMNREWNSLRSLGQKARYLSLLAYATLVAGSTVEQLDEGIQLSYRHLFSILVTAGLVVAMVISIRESHRSRRVR
jgi:DMSO/TMAO reductase YedYZ heme-binding membrane subunit